MTLSFSCFNFSYDSSTDEWLTSFRILFALIIGLSKNIQVVEEIIFSYSVIVGIDQTMYNLNIYIVNLRVKLFVELKLYE